MNVDRDGWKAHFERMNRLVGRRLSDRDYMTSLGWVYFVVAPEIGKVKIGHTGDHPDRRLKRLRDSSPLDLEPLGIIRGSTFLESRLHALFERIHWKREWFHDRAVLREFIAAQTSAWMEADRVNCYREVEVSPAAQIVRAAIERAEKWFEVYDGPPRWVAGPDRSMPLAW